MVYKLTGLITGRAHIYLPRTPPVAHARPSDATVTISWDPGNKSRHRAYAPYDVAEAYIQHAPYRTDETVKYH